MLAATHTAPYWLIVVRPDRQELYVRLCRSFAQTPFVEVIVDRRNGDRRRGSTGVTSDRPRGDRRGGDRRKPRALRAAATDGYRLIERAEGFQVFEADGRVPVRCFECDTLVEFEMPRFGELPARLAVDVIHAEATQYRARHFVEALAYRASGRPFLACRVVAHRPAGLPPKNLN